MKIGINDENGTFLIGVLKLDGTPAIEGQDYVKWRGEYHKNGKWSYTEGGVALKEGIVIENRRSTHRSGNNQKWVYIVSDNEIKHELHVMGRIDETPEKPPVPKGRVSPEVWEKILNCIVEFYLTGDSETVEKVHKMLKSWEEMSKFL